MQQFEIDYTKLLKDILTKGEKQTSRNGPTLNLHGRQLILNPTDGFPMLSGKKIFPKNFLHELKWMLNGDTNVKYLNDNGSKIWDNWADENGDLGPIYGKQFRDFNGVDQVAELIKGFKLNLYSRRHIISLWNPADLDKMALPPCFYTFQVLVNENTIDLVVSQRSADTFIGLPYDMCFYAMFLFLVVNTINSQQTKHRTIGDVIINIGSAHIYEGHINQVEEYLDRVDSLTRYIPTTIPLGDLPTLEEYDPNKIEFLDYNPLPHIKAKIYE
jgi:thymidylate synthase|tara:strand:- start:18395 stop:19210 length:816 start_codon:yes stop_codon:yes gene_type:complete